MTFETVERQIIKLLKDRIIHPEDVNQFGNIKAHIKKRLDGYWAHKERKNNYKSVYNALNLAIDLFYLRNKYDQGFSYPDAKSMMKSYTEELYQFDQYYRLFHENADYAEMEGWDILKDLEDQVEDCYNNWYLDRLAISWERFLDKKNNDSMIDNWSISGVKNQYEFYRSYVDNVLRHTSRSRVFVLISDALRYEAGEELKREINSKYRFKADIEYMLGVLPSYTALGMASLLPHKSIKYQGNTSRITVDGIISNNRSEILESKKGIAIKSEDLTKMDREEGRKFIEPYEVIYIYHNLIDAIGDTQSSENKTFKAVRDSIEELSAIASFIINSLNGSYLLITADHGFIYHHKSPDKLDKSVIEDTPAGAVLSKKRYILGKGLGSLNKVWDGFTNISAKTDDDMEFWLPKGTNRFHFKGGSKFFHGGAMLQEITIPLLKIKEASGKDKEKTVVNKVGVSRIGARNKIVTNKHNFEFIQTDAVGDKRKPRILKISIRDYNELISNEETVTFDSRSSSIDDRKKAVMLTLKSGDYDRKKDYYLVLRDAEDSIEYDRITLSIDLAFSREF